jgi:hypothetical protein
MPIRVLLALVFILRNDLVHPDGAGGAMDVDTREYLRPGQRVFQESDLHFGAVGELRAGFQEHHIIFHHPFADRHTLFSSHHQKSWKQAYKLT